MNDEQRQQQFDRRDSIRQQNNNGDDDCKHDKQKQRGVAGQDAASSASSSSATAMQYPIVASSSSSSSSSSSAAVPSTPRLPSSSSSSIPTPPRARPAPAPPRATAPRAYSSEEVILFRSPSDATHVVVFNLPMRPFIHQQYDLKTVAKARQDANQELRKERKDKRKKDAGITTNASSSSSSSSSLTSSASSSSSSASILVSPPSSSSPGRAAVLCSLYRELHIRNLDRVMQFIAHRCGLVNEMSIQCKPRAASSHQSDKQKQRRRHATPFDDIQDENMDDDDDDDDDGVPSTNMSQIELYESGFNVWSYIRYYSIKHTNVAMKVLNKTRLGPGKSLRADIISRNTAIKVEVKPEPTTSASTAAAASASSSAASAPSSSSSSGPALHPYFPLPYHACLDICNYFLGFNNWNCEIKEIRRYNEATDKDVMEDLVLNSPLYRMSSLSSFSNSWTAIVLVTMGGDSFVCSGVGHAEPKERSTRAKKTAVTNAYRQLFASLALVVLHNGKVAVQVLP